MMPHALQLLLKLQGKSLARRALRGAGTVRGAIFLAVGALLIVLFMLPAVIGGMIAEPTDPSVVRAVVPLGMLAIALFNLIASGGERAIAFTPAEVDFLFPGPFTRRQLLLYRIVKTIAGASFSALIFSLFFLRHASSWLACLLACFTGLMFIQLLSMSIVLVGQTVGERAYSLGRKGVLLALLAALAAAAGPTLLQGFDSGWVDAVQEVRASPVGRVLLAPMEPFGQTLTAQRIFPDLLGWTAAALGVVGALVGLLMWLDANYLEAAAARSQALHDRMQRARQSGIAAHASTRLARWRLPMPPSLHGAGPVAWRQLTTALRNSKALLVMLIVLAVAALPMIVSRRADSVPAGAVVGLTLWCTFFLASMLRFDFRGELDNMDLLKSLPITPAALAVGELLAPVLVMTLLQSLVFLAAAFIAVEGHWILLVGLALAVPINTLLFAVENTLFLLFPMRFANAPGDFQGFGRQMLLLLAKLVILAVAGGICAATGLAAWFLSGGSLPAALIAAALTLLAQAIAIIPLVALSFRRFDPSRDVPP